MGKFGEFMKGVGSTFVNGLSGGLASGLSGAVGGLLGNIGYGKRLKKQVNAQKQLNEQAAELNYQYGEKAAENAYKRQMAMYERSYKDQSYEAMRKQMEDAGLSVGLMYGGSGSGGGAGAMSGAPQGETGGAQAGNAEGPAAQQAANIATAELGLRMANAKADLEVKKAQIKDIEASAEAKRAEAGLKTEQKITELEQRNALIEKLKQEGMSTWIKNVQENWKAFAGKDWGGEPGKVTKYGQENEIYGFYGIAENSYISEQQSVELAKAIAETNRANETGKAAKALAELNSARANGYWQELINATMHAKADETRAAAAKLAAEFETGEYTNWKTWTQIAKEVINTITTIKISK